MDMLKGEQIAEASLTDWRKLAQGLHARCLVDDFGTTVRRLRGRAGGALGHHPSVSIGRGCVARARRITAIAGEARHRKPILNW